MLVLTEEFFCARFHRNPLSEPQGGRVRRSQDDSVAGRVRALHYRSVPVYEDEDLHSYLDAVLGRRGLRCPRSKVSPEAQEPRRGRRPYGRAIGQRDL